jgi:hypothetical protein
MFAALGVDPTSHYHDLTERPYAVSPGQAIAELWNPG